MCHFTALHKNWNERHNNATCIYERFNTVIELDSEFLDIGELKKKKKTETKTEQIIEKSTYKIGCISQTVSCTHSFQFFGQHEIEKKNKVKL